MSVQNNLDPNRLGFQLKKILVPKNVGLNNVVTNNFGCLKFCCSKKVELKNMLYKKTVGETQVLWVRNFADPRQVIQETF